MKIHRVWLVVLLLLLLVLVLLLLLELLLLLLRELLLLVLHLVEDRMHRLVVRVRVVHAAQLDARAKVRAVVHRVGRHGPAARERLELRDDARAQIHVREGVAIELLEIQQVDVLLDLRGKKRSNKQA